MKDRLINFGKYVLKGFLTMSIVLTILAVGLLVIGTGIYAYDIFKDAELWAQMTVGGVGAVVFFAVVGWLVTDDD